MWLEQVIFYIFALSLIGFALTVIIVRNPVYAAFALVLAFFASAGLWILLEAEFLALILVLVYVGAVMTLFLFVVMMLNLDLEPLRQGFVRYLPFGILVIALAIAAMIYVVGPTHFGLASMTPPPHQPASYSNVTALGDVLYTTYVYPFELAAVLLLIAMITAITLGLRKPRAKRQDVSQQLRANRKDRVRLIKMKSEELHRGLQ